MLEYKSEKRSERLARMSVLIGQSLGLAQEDLNHLKHGVMIHNIGIIGICDRLSQRQETLVWDELKKACKDPGVAEKLGSCICYFRPALDVPYSYHEKWDGSGYPQGLQGTEIPISARIFSVVKTWSSLTSDRPYRRAWPREDVRNYLLEQKGKRFDTEVVDAFLRLGIDC